MKKIVIVLSAIVIATILNCSDNGVTNEEQEGLSNEEQEAIEQSYAAVSVTADSILIIEDPISGFENILTTYLNDPNIENAWISENALYIKYEKGGIVSWYISSESTKPPYLPKTINTNETYQSHGNNVVGNEKVCLINQVFNDEKFSSCQTIINNLSTNFTQNDFQVTTVNGSNADLDFFDSELSKYGTIFLITHGHYDDTNNWILTGENGDIDLLTKLYYTLWYNNKISISTVKEKRNGVDVTVQYLSISNLYIDDKYESDVFPNTLFYTCACQFLKSQTFSNVLINCGAAAVIGWDETNCKGHYIGEHLMNLMLGGVSLEDAFDELPDESKVDYCHITEGANLKYYPQAGGTLHLVETILNPPIITFNSPVDGYTYANRILNLAGYVSNAQSIDYGTAEINQVTTTLEFSGLNFSQPIVIQQGENTIEVTCLVKQDNNQSANANSTIQVIGDFPTLDLFTELRWNTDFSDVDLHLLPPNSTLDDLWSDNDCFYHNMSTVWGGELDIDDVEGYGPEHIEITSATRSGTYRLFIHFYDDDGAGNTDAFVDVSTKGSNIIQFGPYHLVHSYAGYNTNGSIGDIYEVCTINFPSGTVTPVNQYRYRTTMQASELRIINKKRQK